MLVEAGGGEADARKKKYGVKDILLSEREGGREDRGIQ